MDDEKPKGHFVISPERVKRLLGQLLEKNVSSQQADTTFRIYALMDFPTLADTMIMALDKDEIINLLNFAKELSNQPDYINDSKISFLDNNREAKRVDSIEKFDAEGFADSIQAEIDNELAKLHQYSYLNVPPKVKEGAIWLGMKASGLAPFFNETEVKSFLLIPVTQHG